MNHYIYKITNNINNKYYYGKRSCKCAIDQDPYMGSGKLLKKALLKYGTDNFTKEILAICDSSEDALELEEMVVTIKEVNDYMCYNLKLGGSGGCIPGRKDSEETKAKKSKAQHGRIYDDVFNAKVSKGKIAKNNKGINNKVCKPVIQLSMSGEFIKEWISATEVYDTIGREKIGHISEVCKGKRRTAGGFKWKYKE